jgi:hypothetical protein
LKFHPRLLSSILFILLFLFPLPGNGQPVQAQAEELGVVITYPSEGETFYVGPSALLYSVHITGYVTGGDETQPYQVRLELFQGEVPSGSQDSLTQGDRSFKFNVTVNPDGIQRGFVTFERDCPQCHFKSELNFPPGRVLLRITATGSDGQSAQAERNIVIDKSGFKEVSVQVVPVEAGSTLPPGLNVNASTWLYMWRARSSSGILDDSGKAQVKLEALSEVNTRYVFKLGPELIDGKLYESIEPVEVILSPEVEITEPVILQVRSHWGSINGKLVGEALTSPVAVDAIYLIDGQRFTTESSSSGSFRFDNVPIGPYLVIAEPEELNRQSLAAESQLVDLRPNGEGVVNLPLTTAQRQVIQGNVTGIEGDWLPFAWVDVDSLPPGSAIQPNTGNFAVYGLPEKASAITVSAPGFYSQARVLEGDAKQIGVYDFQLVPQPETQHLPWNSGQVIIPPETQVSIEAQHLTLTRGWLWGEGGDTTALRITAAGIEIELFEAKFALEYLPGEATWLYLISGQASVLSDMSRQPVVMSGGQLLSLASSDLPNPVPFDPVTMQAFHSMTESPVTAVWEPSLKAQIQNRLTQLGVNTAQIITFVTYLAVLLSLVGLPFVAVKWWNTRKRNG